MLLLSPCFILCRYISSSFAYLLAYAVWNVMQALLTIVVPGELLTATPWLWFDAVVVLALSGLLLVVFNVRVHSALGDDTKAGSDNVSASLLSHLCWYQLIERLVKRQRVSTARLHIRVDVLDSQVTSSQYQMMAESLSYIIALSLGAALTASLPAVPSDAAQYNYEVQPSSRALVIYAMSCSVVLAGATLWLERWVRKQERKNREHASAVLKERREHKRERIAVKEVRKLSNGQQGSGGGFSANTHETALYILRKQQKCEKILRGREDEEDKREMEERKKRQRAVRHSPSPSTQIVSPVPLINIGSPLLSPPQSATGASVPERTVHYGSSVDWSGSPSPLFTSSASVPTTPLFSPLWSEPSPSNASTVSFLSSPSDPLLPPSSSASSSASSASVHRSILSTTFLTQYYIAIASTLCQGFALLVAYSWVGVFSLVLFPALRRWSVLLDVTDVTINAVWSSATFVIYFGLILGAARIFHRDEVFEL